MDPRRFLILAGLGLSLSGCAVFGRTSGPPMSPQPIVTAEAAVSAEAGALPQSTTPVDGALVADATPAPAVPVGIPYEVQPIAAAPAAGMTGRRAIVAANLDARAASRSDAFVGGVQVFAWSPGRVFEVWTAPLRVTTLTLSAPPITAIH